VYSRNASEQLPLADHDEVISELTSKRPDEPFGIAILPRRARGNAELPDAKVVHALVERSAEDPIAIADEQLERSVLTEGLDDLLRCPYGVRMGGYVHVEYPPPFEREHDEDIEHIERHRSER
jgi:hypothetical protein